MRTKIFAAALAATALSTGLAMAQTAPPPAATPPAATMAEKPAMSPAAASTKFMTVLPSDQMRGSKLMGVDVYGSDNAKIGDIDEVILDRDGKIQAVVIGVGGFLGIGKKDVAFPFSELTFVDEPPRMAAAPAAGVTAPANPNAPATTGSTATTTTTTENDGVPDRATVKMTKADLQSAPEFHYSARSATSATTNTAPPASRTMPPAAKP